MASLLYIACCVAFVAQAFGNPDWKPSWSNCGRENEILKIKSITLDHYLQPGHQYNVTVISLLTKKVSGGSFNLTMKYYLPNHQNVTLLKATLNLCDLLTEVKQPCPLSPGQYVFQYHDKLPEYLPKGLYSFLVAASKDYNDEEIFCLRAKVKLF